MLTLLDFFFLLFSGIFLLSVHHIFANRKNRILILNKPNGHHEIGLMNLFGNVKYYLFTGEYYVERLSFRKVNPRKQKQLAFYYKENLNV